MAAGTRLVSSIQRDLLNARLVASRARRHVAQGELESVRRVAARASGGAMRAAIGGCKLVTGGASTHLRCFRRSRGSGMWIVTADAVAGALRMIRMHALVARGTGCERRAQNVMRRVAVGATVVRSDVPGADDIDLRMAVATRNGILLIESMRLVAAGARGVPARKQRGCGDDGLFFGVTCAASLQRVSCRRVTLRMTSGAGFDQ